MHGPCLPGRPELLSGSRSASSPVPPSPENRQGYTPPDTVPAPKKLLTNGTFCFILHPPHPICPALPLMPDKLLHTILYKIVWSVERSCNDKFASVFVEFWNTEILTWILSQEYHQPLQKSRHICRILLVWDAFSAQDATLFHPSAENTELGTCYDINCSYSSDKIKQILCFPLRPQMSGGTGQQTLPRSAAGKAGQCFSLSISKRNTPPAI